MKGGNGIGIGTVLFIVFLILKLTGVIAWSWWWVTAPLWIPALLLLAGVVDPRRGRRAMTGQRPAVVRQLEAGPNADNLGDYWFTVSLGNGETMLTSKMYRDRWRAIRAARSAIARLAGEVTFTYWTGFTPTQEAEARALGRTPRGKLEHVVERIRYRGTTETIVDRSG